MLNRLKSQKADFPYLKSMPTRADENFKKSFCYLSHISGHEKCLFFAFHFTSRHVCACFWLSANSNRQHNSIPYFLLSLQGRDATPYLERNRVGRDAIDSAAALTDMGKYLFRERRLPVYDIAVAITK